MSDINQSTASSVPALVTPEFIAGLERARDRMHEHADQLAQRSAELRREADRFEERAAVVRQNAEQQQEIIDRLRVQFAEQDPEVIHQAVWYGTGPFSAVSQPGEKECWCGAAIVPASGPHPWLHVRRPDVSTAHLCYPGDPASKATAAPRQMPETGVVAPPAGPEQDGTRILPDPLGELPPEQERTFQAFAGTPDPDGQPVFGGDPYPPAGGEQ